MERLLRPPFVLLRRHSRSGEDPIVRINKPQDEKSPVTRLRRILQPVGGQISSRPGLSREIPNSLELVDAMLQRVWKAEEPTLWSGHAS